MTDNEQKAKARLCELAWQYWVKHNQLVYVAGKRKPHYRLKKLKW